MEHARRVAVIPTNRAVKLTRISKQVRLFHPFLHVGNDQVNIVLNQVSSTIIESLDEFFDQKKPDDLLVLYFSGHGALLLLAVIFVRLTP